MCRTSLNQHKIQFQSKKQQTITSERSSLPLEILIDEAISNEACTAEYILFGIQRIYLGPIIAGTFIQVVASIRIIIRRIEHNSIFHNEPNHSGVF